MNKNKLIKIGTIAVLVFVFLIQLAPIALAIDSNIYPPDVGLPGGSPNALGIRTTIANFVKNILLPIAGIIAVLFIIIGGYQYMFSGANEELAETGKKTLQNAIIGLVIIIISYIIVNVIINAVLCAGQGGSCVY